MEVNFKNAQEFQAIQIKTEYCGSFTQDNDMAILEIISELLVAELKNIFKSLEANVKDGSKVSRFFCFNVYLTPMTEFLSKISSL